MDLKKSFAVSTRKAVEGIWESMDSDTQILVAKSGNARYEEELQKAIRPYRNQIRRNQMSPEKNLDIIATVMSRTILLDWKDLYENETLVPYSQENAKRLLLSYPEFRQYVSDLADDVSRYIEEDLEEAGES